MMSISSRLASALFGARWWAAAGLVSALACGGADAEPSADDPAPTREEAPAELQRGGRQERSSLGTGSEESAPPTNLRPDVAGCAGTCAQICDCLAAACARDGAGSACGGSVVECRASCNGSTCRAGEPGCVPLIPGREALPPEDPEPAPPGPGPDPSPIEAPNSSANSGTGVQGQGYAPGGY